MSSADDCTQETIRDFLTILSVDPPALAGSINIESDSEDGTSMKINDLDVASSVLDAYETDR